MKILGTPEAAERLGITVARVQHLIWAGRLPAQKLGRDYVIQEDDLKLVADRKTGRPPGKQPAAKSAATRPATVSNGTLTKKRGKR
jgi:excisionase family DNA binding protein